MSVRSWALIPVVLCCMVVFHTPVANAWIKKRNDVDVPTKVVVVQRGDTLRQLAARHLGNPDRWKEFLEYNQFSNPHALSPGERLHIPVTGTTPSGTAVKPTPVRPPSISVRPAGPPNRILWITEQAGFSLEAPQIVVVRVEDAAGVPIPMARVEWTLNTSPNAVGDILEADDDPMPVRGKPKDPILQGKITNRYAVTFTNDRPATLDLGDEPMVIGIGESWISLQSVSLGITDVTVFCPAIDRQHEYFSTRSISWTDVQWEQTGMSESDIDFGTLPNNVVTIPVDLRHGSDGAPAVGINVHYALLTDGPRATFAGDATELTTVTDMQGHAEARLSLRDTSGGTQRVRIELLDEDDTVIAARVFTHIWKGPTLQLSMDGPMTLGLLDHADYTIRARNTGTETVSGITLTQSLPPKGITVVNIGNGGQASEGQVSWTIGSLLPDGEVSRALSIQAIAAGTWLGELQLTGEGGVRVSSSSEIRVELPQLELEVTGPATAQVGQELNYVVRVTNPSVLRATNVLVNHTLPQTGISLIDSSQRVAREEQSLIWYADIMEAGASRELKLRFRAETGGEHILQAKVSCNEGVRTHAHASTNVLASEISLTGQVEPTTANLGDSATLRFVVKNSGSLNATGLMLMASLPQGLEFIEASHGGTASGEGTVSWRLAGLSAGTEHTVSVTAKAVTAGNHTSRASLTYHEGTLLEAEMLLNVVAHPVIQVTTTDNADPVNVSGEITYTTVVKNDGPGGASDVVLSIVLPEGLRVIETTSTTGRRVMQGNNLDFTIGTLSAGQQAIVTVRLLTLQPGSFVHSALLSCNELSESIRVEESTSVEE